ncbi:hypothetical protein C4D60_Mb01t24020 [Musa balbisiana]|uniref:Uncharacterized protein n=1 Tax=Musa balbisiana TaxID=52838 RepID=A0A4S8JQ87_MUSBA|nr:hypothetical protein C4D60_Mb01t24020 [Musa balbisiana]
MSIASVLSVAWATIATPGFGGIDNFSSVEFEVVGSEPITRYVRTQTARRRPEISCVNHKTNCSK